MEFYKNFQIGTIVWAYYLINADEERMQKDIDALKACIPLKKAYLENHRGLVDVPQEKMRMAKAIFERNGIDPGGSGDNMTRWIEQANLTMFAKAKELMLFPQPLPSRHMDCCTHIPEPAEFAVEVQLWPGSSRFFRILR